MYSIKCHYPTIESITSFSHIWEDGYDLSPTNIFYGILGAFLLFNPLFGGGGAFFYKSYKTCVKYHFSSHFEEMIMIYLEKTHFSAFLGVVANFPLSRGQDSQKVFQNFHC